MPDSTLRSLTRHLNDAWRGDPSAIDRVWRRLERELLRTARSKLRRRGWLIRQLDASDLVQSVFFKLFGKPRTVGWKSRKHFHCYAARAMANLLTDIERKNDVLRDAVDDGNGLIEAAASSLSPDPAFRSAVRGLVDRLAEARPRTAEVVLLRYFAGRTERQVGEWLGICRRAVQQEWAFARAWLHREYERNVMDDDPDTVLPPSALAA